MGWFPLLAPKKDINWLLFVELRFTPTLTAFNTLVVFASIQFVPEPVDAKSCPEFPVSPVVSLKAPVRYKSLLENKLPETVAIPVTSAFLHVISSSDISPLKVTSLLKVETPTTFNSETEIKPDLVKS